MSKFLLEFWRLSCSLAVLWRQTCRAKSRFLRLLLRSVRLRSARLRWANSPSARDRWSRATDRWNTPLSGMPLSDVTRPLFYSGRVLRQFPLARISLQFGRVSAPMIPQRVQTIRRRKARARGNKNISRTPAHTSPDCDKEEQSKGYGAET